MAEHASRTRPIDEVGRTGIYPASGPLPSGAALVRGQAELGHPEEHRTQRLLSGHVSLTAPLLAARAIFGGFFLYNGVNHFQNFTAMKEYAQSKGTPMPAVAVAGSGLMLIAGGLSLLTGIRPKIGASLVSTFLAGVSPQMHAFWKETDPQARMNEMINFTKNMALVGGAMFAAAVPEPWPVAPAIRSAP
jgi:putative oxidoreductase